MKILAVEPMNHSHWEFDNRLVSALSKIGSVTFVCPEEYQNRCSAEAEEQMTIPKQYFRTKNSVLTRINSIRVLLHLRKLSRSAEYDVVVFLAYETLPFAFVWKSPVPTLVVEHNNIAGAERGFLRGVLYSLISRCTFSLVFMQEAKEALASRWGRRAFVIPHPAIVDAKNLRESYIDPICGKLGASLGKTIIFSPSASTKEYETQALREFVSRNSSSYFAYIKDRIAIENDSIVSRPFFENYESIFSACDLVFIGKMEEYRVSGVAYDALKNSKPIAIYESSFSVGLKNEYPSIVHLIGSASDIVGLDLNSGNEEVEFERFRSEHSIESVSKAIRDCISKILST